MKTEVLYTKMDEVFGPQENFSKDMLNDKWKVLPYEGDTLCGNMIVSDTYEADDIYFDNIQFYIYGESSSPCFYDINMEKINRF